MNKTTTGFEIPAAGGKDRILTEVAGMRAQMGHLGYLNMAHRLAEEYGFGQQAPQPELQPAAPAAEASPVAQQSAATVAALRQVEAAAPRSSADILRSF